MTTGHRYELPSGRWFGVRGERDYADPARGFRLAIGEGFLASGNWSLVGPPMPKAEVERLASQVFDAMALHARIEDDRREADFA